MLIGEASARAETAVNFSILVTLSNQRVYFFDDEIIFINTVRIILKLLLIMSQDKYIIENSS